MKIASFSAVILGLAATLLASPAEAAKQRYIVIPRRGMFGTPQANALFGNFSATIKTIHRLSTLAARAVDVDDENDLETLRGNPLISEVFKDEQRMPLESSFTPFSAVRRGLQRQQPERVPYGVKMIGADVTPLAPGTTRKDLMVCIIDSGLNAAHEDLSGVDLSGNTDGAWKNDNCGHGTHVAGTIAATKGNGKGVVGVAPGVSLHIVKVFEGSDCRWSWSSDLLAAIEQCQAAANGAKLVVSMSLGGPTPSRGEELGFQKLWDQGVLTIAAAGNDGTTTKSYPGSYPSVMSVAALDEQRRVAQFSQKNNEVDVAAPGVKVLSTYLNGGYALLDGTSMATPHVSAAAALVWSYGLKQGWNNQKVRDALTSTAFDLGTPGVDNSYGFGLINACKAARLAGFDGSRSVACPDESAQPPAATPVPTTTANLRTSAAPTTTAAAPAPGTTSAPTQGNPTTPPAATTRAPVTGQPTQPGTQCPFKNYFFCCYIYGQC